MTIRILTGNDLPTGDVVWWTGSDWSRHIADAVDVGVEGEAIAAREDGARRVNVPYVLAADLTPEGPRPAHIKDRIRAAGPTVHPQFAVAPSDPKSGSWVI